MFVTRNTRKKGTIAIQRESRNYVTVTAAKTVSLRQEN